MCNTNIALINPKMLKWTRKVAGYSLDQVAKASLLAHIGGWGDAKEILVRAEKKERVLTTKEMYKLAKMYKMPPAAFYLSKPPFPWWYGWLFLGVK